MEDIPDIYNLETIEQMRAIADPLRVGIIQALAFQAMTATQLGGALGLPANKVHYHVRELEKAGLVRLVETREKGGILEKYYRTVARDFRVPTALFSAAPDESVAVIADHLERILHEYLQALSRRARTSTKEPAELTLVSGRLWLTEEEDKRLTEEVEKLAEPYMKPRGIAGERQWTVVQIAYPTPDSTDDDERPHPQRMT